MNRKEILGMGRQGSRLRLIAAAVIAMAAIGPATARSAESGALRVHNIFRSNMVIQRDKPITIWGWAETGRKVSVQFGRTKAGATAGGEAGRWEVTFPARQANAASQKLTVTSGDETIEMDNILLGDIWVMNGQSNMAFGLGKTYRADMETATARLPLLRQGFFAPVLIASLTEHMGVSTQHLVGDVLCDIVEIELSLFLGDARMKHDVEQQVAELLFQVLGVIAFDCIDQFVGFIEGMACDAATGLANIPGTAALGIAQIHHDLQQVFNCTHRLYCVLRFKNPIIPAF